MLLLVTVLLVLAGAILLLVGFLANSLAYIFVSILCAAIAAVALVVFSRLTRRRALRLAADGPMGAVDPVTVRPGDDTRSEPGFRSGPATTAARGAATFDAGDASTTAPMRVPTGVAPDDEAEDEADAWDDGVEGWDDEEDWGDEIVFPIEDYDELRVGEIMPLLPELDPDELEEVRDREASGKARGTILGRIGELLGDTAAVGLRSSGQAAPPGPFGAGSAAPRSDGSAPPGFSIKAKSASGLYHAPESRYYSRTSPDVWFATEEDARAAGFIRWDARQQSSGTPAGRAASKASASKPTGGTARKATRAGSGGARTGASAPRKATKSTGEAPARSKGGSAAAAQTPPQGEPLPAEPTEG